MLQHRLGSVWTRFRAAGLVSVLGEAPDTEFESTLHVSPQHQQPREILKGAQTIGSGCMLMILLYSVAIKWWTQVGFAALASSIFLCPPKHECWCSLCSLYGMGFSCYKAYCYLIILVDQEGEETDAFETDFPIAWFLFAASFVAVIAFAVALVKLLHGAVEMRDLQIVEKDANVAVGQERTVKFGSATPQSKLTLVLHDLHDVERGFPSFIPSIPSDYTIVHPLPPSSEPPPRLSFILPRLPSTEKRAPAIYSATSTIRNPLPSVEPSAKISVRPAGSSIVPSSIASLPHTDTSLPLTSSVPSYMFPSTISYIVSSGPPFLEIQRSLSPINVDRNPPATLEPQGNQPSRLVVWWYNHA
eukprot:Blabericola_migrator_1__2678@NODE_175_length_12037_cov_81_938346_g152_i0_p4_GENE_NODE_175_length_12037_cov_81_938346_g152_i0NODE_175_length_12037_cov_81_938346_g152_i0_p4_ORF_typecomplete_len359_score39_06_NODE_175_length_12037_cov_81_938346_g152_i022473323